MLHVLALLFFLLEQLFYLRHLFVIDIITLAASPNSKTNYQSRAFHIIGAQEENPAKE